MSRGRLRRFGRVGRRPDHWSSPHERARVRAAERLESPLPAGEYAWLEAHLADCDPCRAVADAYATERLALRQLRHEDAVPPRDLWARTAAAIEHESLDRRPESAPARAPRGTSLPALRALSGLALVALVVVTTAISGGFFGRIGMGPGVADGSFVLASQEIAPQPTALAVGAGKVQWLGAGRDGVFAYNVAHIDAVCPLDRQPDCAPVEDGHAERVTLSATPKFVFQSPVNDQAVIVGTDADGADAILVVALPTPDPTPEASIAPGPVGSTASDAAAPTPGPTTSPLPSLAAATVSPADLPSVPPSAVGSANPPSDAPTASGSPGTAEATGEPGVEAVAIITDVIVVGRAASYSPDGAWFAFSARPADGAVGPDIYVWHVGELQARALTTDHASVFASWVGGSLLGSRLIPEPIIERQVVDPVESPSIAPTIENPLPDDVVPSLEPSPQAVGVLLPEQFAQTFLLDPWTGVEIAQLDAEWQPAVDPTGVAVVAWQGTVGIGEDGLTVAPANGNLMIHPYHGPLESDAPEASSTPSTDASPALSAEPSTEPSAEVSPAASAQVARDWPAQVVVAGPIADFDARWDETGSWLAIWIADSIDPGLGRLSLLHFDPVTGLVDRPPGAPQEVTALPGFSIGFGRLAWASPPGQSGEGSRIQIAAWTSDEVGAVESIPVETPIVVQ